MSLSSEKQNLDLDLLGWVQSVAGHNVDGKNVDSHNVEKSKCRQWKWRKSECRKCHTHAVHSTCVFSILYLCFNGSSYESERRTNFTAWWICRKKCPPWTLSGRRCATDGIWHVQQQLLQLLWIRLSFPMRSSKRPMVDNSCFMIPAQIESLSTRRKQIWKKWWIHVTGSWTVLLKRCLRNILRIVFAILTFAISIVDFLTYRHFDFDIVTVDIFIVDILTVNPWSAAVFDPQSLFANTPKNSVSTLVLNQTLVSE